MIMDDYTKLCITDLGSTTVHAEPLKSGDEKSDSKIAINADPTETVHGISNVQVSEEGNDNDAVSDDSKSFEVLREKDETHEGVAAESNCAKDMHAGSKSLEDTPKAIEVVPEDTNALDDIQIEERVHEKVELYPSIDLAITVHENSQVSTTGNEITNNEQGVNKMKCEETDTQAQVNDESKFSRIDHVHSTVDITLEQPTKCNGSESQISTDPMESIPMKNFVAPSKEPEVSAVLEITPNETTKDQDFQGADIVNADNEFNGNIAINEHPSTLDDKENVLEVCKPDPPSDDEGDLLHASTASIELSPVKTKHAISIHDNDTEIMSIKPDPPEFSTVTLDASIVGVYYEEETVVNDFQQISKEKNIVTTNGNGDLPAASTKTEQVEIECSNDVVVHDTPTDKFHLGVKSSDVLNVDEFEKKSDARSMLDDHCISESIFPENVNIITEIETSAPPHSGNPNEYDPSATSSGVATVSYVNEVVKLSESFSPSVNNERVTTEMIPNFVNNDIADCPFTTADEIGTSTAPTTCKNDHNDAISQGSKGNTEMIGTPEGNDSCDVAINQEVSMVETMKEVICRPVVDNQIISPDSLISQPELSELSASQVIQPSVTDPVAAVDDDNCSYEEIIIDDDDEFVEYFDEILDDDAFTEETYDSQNSGDLNFIIGNVGEFHGNTSLSSIGNDQGHHKRPVIKSATMKALEQEEAAKTAEANETLKDVTYRLARRNSFCRKDDEFRKQLEMEEEEHRLQEEEEERVRVAEQEQSSRLKAEKALAVIAQQEKEEMRQKLYDEEQRRQAAEAEAYRQAAEEAAKEKAAIDKARREAEEKEKMERDAKRQAMEEEVRQLQAKLAEAKEAAELAKKKQLEEKIRLKAKVEAHRRERRRSSITSTDPETSFKVEKVQTEVTEDVDTSTLQTLKDSAKDAATNAINVYYPIDSLRKQSIPGLDYKNREIYIHPDEFKTLFMMSIEEFNELPKWKKTNMKRKLKLF